MTTTLGQQRAKFCLEQLENLSCSRADFKPFSAGLPAMILQNGFGQTLAFLVAKGSKLDKKTKKVIFQKKDKHYNAFVIITRWLCQQNILTSGTEREYLGQISAMGQGNYLQAQKETLAMLEWLKRYANAALFEEAN